MITKEMFVNTMSKLEELDTKMSAVDDAMRSLCGDFGSFYVADIFYITIDLLQEIFRDQENNNLRYFVWERDWLHNFKLGDIMVDDKPVKIDNWGNVYDFLVDCMEE